VDEFAVVRMEGRPAASVSFWIKGRSSFGNIRRSMERDETMVDVRIYGRKFLTIEHRITPSKRNADDASLH
jgi:hypothetical protein